MARPEIEEQARQVDTYDLFVSFADRDRDWVYGYLLPSLGLPAQQVITRDDFVPGAPLVDEFARAVERSRITTVVLSGAYLADEWAALGEQLASFSRVEGGRALVPAVLEDVDLPLQLEYLVRLDCTEPDRWDAEVARLRDLLDRPSPEPESLPCPYPGMVPFSADDARFFHGREEEIADLLRRLRHCRRICVIGPSGSGKSSLLTAGALPQLGRRQGSAVLVRTMRPGPTPVATLAATLGAPVGTDVADADTLGRVIGALADSHGAERVVLVVDQLEEAFAQAPPTEQRAFLSALAALPSAERCQLLLAVRADFYPDLMTSPLWPLAEGERVEIAPLAGPALARAIVAPASAVGVHLEPELVERLLADAAQEPGVLPLIQETMVLLWEQRTRRLLTLAAYERLGGEGRSGLAVALASKADATLTALSPVQQAIARRIFLRQVQLGEGRDDTRRQQTISALRSSEPPELFEATLRHLTDHRLLTLGGEPGEERTVDLAHEAMIACWPTLRTWIAADREGLRVQRQLSEDAREWNALGRDPSALYRGVRLVTAGEWADEHRSDLNDLEREFVDASRALAAREREAEQRANRRLRRLVVGLACLLVVAGAAGALALRAQIEANRQADIAEQEARLSQARYLAAQSAADADDNLARSLLLGLESLNTQDTVQGWTELLSSLQGFTAVETLLHSEGGVPEAVARSADGSRFITSTLEGNLLVRDGTTMERLPPIATGHGPVRDVAISADGGLIVSGGDDGNVRRWDGTTGAPLGAPMTGHSDLVVAVALSSDEALVASASFDGTARLWDADSGAPVSEPLSGHDGRVQAAAFSPDGDTLATGGHDGRVVLWDVESGTARGEIQAHEDRVRTVAWNPDGTLLATGSLDSTIRLWDPATRTPVGEALRGHDRLVVGVAFSPDGSLLASVSEDQTVQIWSVTERRRVRPPLQAHGAQVRDVAFAPDGSTLATVSYDGLTVVWDLRSEQRLASTFAVDEPVRAVAYSADGAMLATVGDGPLVRLWSTDTLRSLGNPLEGHDGWVRTAAFSSDGLLATGGDDGTVRLWDTGSGAAHGEPLAAHDGWVRAVAFSPDGTRLASAGEDGTVRLWDAATGGPVGDPLVASEAPVRTLAFSPDGSVLATGGQDRMIRLWDAATTTPLGAPLQAHTGTVRSLSFSPDGTRLASGGEDARVQIWDVASGEPAGAPLAGPDYRVTSVAWDPAGDILASGSYDHTVVLWDVERRRQLGPALQGHEHWVESLAFSPDGTKLASAGIDGRVMVWDTDRDVWRAQACLLAARNLTPQEWEEFIGADRPYAQTCPQLPGGDRS